MKKETSSPAPFVILSPVSKWAAGPNPFKRQPEKHDPRSRTIPDDSFTIKELFDRYRQGAPLPIGIERPINYGDNPDHNDLDYSSIQRMDLATAQDYLQRVQTTKDTITQRLSEIEALKQAQSAPKMAENAPKSPA